MLLARKLGFILYIEKGERVVCESIVRIEGNMNLLMLQGLDEGWFDQFDGGIFDLVDVRNV